MAMAGKPWVRKKTEQIVECFSNFDTNRDGKIARDELARVLGNLNTAFSKTDVNQVLDLMDKNGDGFIDYSEFALWSEGAIMKTNPVTSNSLLANAEDRKRYEEACFKYFDVMLKESLTLAEVIACVEEVFKHVGLKALPAKVVEKAVAEQSSSGDNTLTLPDFLTFFDRMLHFISKQGAGEKEMMNFAGNIRTNGPKDGIYVADSWYNNVLFFAKGSSEGVVVAGYSPGVKYSERSGFSPYGLALDSRGGLYVSDLAKHQVQFFTKGRVAGITVAGGRGEGCDDCQLDCPGGLAVDTSGGLYVADSNNNRVQFFAKGSTLGLTVAGQQPGELNKPDGIALDAAGGLYVADTLNHRVQFFAKGSSEGVTVAGGQGAGCGPEQLNGPCGIALDAEGGLYVADASNNRLQFFPKGSTMGVTIAEGEIQSVAVDATGNICVTKNGHGKPPYSGDRILLFARGCSAAETSAGPEEFEFSGTARGVCVSAQPQLVLSLQPSEPTEFGCLNVVCLNLAGESLAALDVTPEVSVSSFLEMLSAKGGALQECALKLVLPGGRLIPEEDYGLQITSMLQ